MLLSVRVKPGSSRNKVEADGSGHAVVWTSQKPVDGKANAAVLGMLAEHYGVKRSAVRLVSGPASRVKRFEIDLDKK